MNRQYMGLQMVMVELAKQISAVDRLGEYLAFMTKAAEREPERPNDPAFLKAQAGMKALRELAAAFIVVAEKTKALEAELAKP